MEIARQTTRKDNVVKLTFAVTAVLVALPVLAHPAAGQEFLQEGQFRLAWGNDVLRGKPAAWSSDKGVLYWLTDADDPQAIVKIRHRGDHWQLDIAVTTHAKSTLAAVHNDTNALWSVRTGIAREVVRGYQNWRNYDPDDLATCIIPRGASRKAWRCYPGLSLQIKDAWTLDGEIPPHYFAANEGATGLRRAGSTPADSRSQQP